MAHFIVRNLENEVKDRLQQRALRHGRSIEEEVRYILRDAVKDEGRQSAGGQGSEFSALFAGNGLDDDVPELGGHPVRPANFDD